jgi:hypothetical protein
MRPYSDTALADRSNAPMPAARAAAQPWLIAGRLLLAPFPPRSGGLTAREAEAIEEMGARIDRDGRAGLLPDSTAFWFNPIDGAATPLAASGAWIRCTARQHVVVDLHLLHAMGRVVPITLLLRRPTPDLGPVPRATRGRPKNADQAEAVFAA